MTADWDIVQLSEIARRLTRKNAEGNENVLTISARDGLVNQESYFNKRVASKDLSKYFLLHRGDFAYNKSSSNGYPIGAIKRLEKYSKGVVSPLYICFEIEDTGRAEPDFLVQFFESGLFEKEVRSIAKEGARAHGALNVKPTEFLALRLPLPPFPEQRKIAAILSSVDEVIEKTEAVIEQIQVVKKAMMQELLTRGLPGRHTRFKQTEIGEMPEEWEVVAFRDVCTKISDGVHKKPEYVGSGVPFVTVKNLTAGPGISFDDLNYVTQSDHEDFIKRTHPELGDVLLSKDGTLGVPRIIETSKPFSIFVSVALLKPKRDLIDSHFLRYALEAPPVADQFFLNKSGSALKHIHLVDLRKTLCPLPPLIEQVELATRLREVDGRLFAEQATSEAVTNVKSALMSALLTGEVRVTPHEEAA